MVRKLKSLPPKSPPSASEWEAVGLIQGPTASTNSWNSWTQNDVSKEGKKNKTSKEEELLQFLFMLPPQSPLTSPRQRREGEKSARSSSSSLACQGYCTNPIRRHQGRAWEAKSSYPKLASLPPSVPLQLSTVPIDLDNDLDFHLSLVLSHTMVTIKPCHPRPSHLNWRDRNTPQTCKEVTVPASGLCLILTLFFLLFFYLMSYLNL